MDEAIPIRKTGWNREDWEAIRAAGVLQAVGLPTGKRTNEQQMAVLLDAFDIFLERNEDREDLWAEYDAEDALLHIRSKAARLERVREKMRDGWDPTKLRKKDLDEAYDLINYCAFFIRYVLDWMP
jgi:hypothetical protein